MHDDVVPSVTQLCFPPRRSRSKVRTLQLFIAESCPSASWTEWKDHFRCVGRRMKRLYVGSSSHSSPRCTNRGTLLCLPRDVLEESNTRFCTKKTIYVTYTFNGRNNTWIVCQVSTAQGHMCVQIYCMFIAHFENTNSLYLTELKETFYWNHYGSFKA